MSKFQNRLSCNSGCSFSENKKETETKEELNKSSSCQNSNIKEIQITDGKVIVFYKNCSYDILGSEVLTFLKENNQDKYAEKFEELGNTLNQVKEEIAQKANQSDLDKLVENIVPIQDFGGTVSFQAISKDYSK